MLLFCSTISPCNLERKIDSDKKVRFLINKSDGHLDTKRRQPIYAMRQDFLLRKLLGEELFPQTTLASTSGDAQRSVSTT